MTCIQSVQNANLVVYFNKPPDEVEILIHPGDTVISCNSPLVPHTHDTCPKKGIQDGKTDEKGK